MALHILYQRHNKDNYSYTLIVLISISSCLAVFEKYDKTKIVHMMCRCFWYLFDVEKLAQLRLPKYEYRAGYTDDEVNAEEA